MKDSELNQLLQLARNAQGRVDLSAREYGFETRLGARLANGASRLLSPVQAVWRSVLGLAAVVGVMAFWFAATRSTAEVEDNMVAFWSGAESSWNLQLDPN